MVPSQKNKHMLKVVEALKTIQDLVYSAPCFLAAEDVDLLRKTCDRLGRHYQKLSVDAFEHNLTRWNTVTKFHFTLAHLAQQAELINPRWVQGYVSESMVGTASDIYSMCQSGPFHRVVQKTVMLKYRAGMKLMWEQ